MGDRVVNICFHGIGEPGRPLEPGEDRYWISPAEYLRIVDEVATWPSARISFDDGNASDVSIGLAPLLQRDLTATFFVLAGRLDAPGSLTGDDVRRLAGNGMTIGTHGMDHVPWRGLSGQAWDRELVQARRRLADVAEQPVDLAALPLGRYDRKLLVDLRRLGYATVYSSDRRAARGDAWLQPRYSVRRDDTAESLRDTALHPPRRPRRLLAAAKGTVKRLR